MMKDRKFDLQDRLIDFAVRIIKLSESLPDTNAGTHIRSQMLRSGTLPASNYGEAQSAESTADFIHKMKIALKELRETYVWLKIILKAKLIKPEEMVVSLIDEANQLIAIFIKSAETAKKNEKEKKKY